ncbi:hypothetical protein BDN70DRAFT_990451 [Pholiota conissans]|uniref:F-box domain-containing protein n=1 Tax=Pholiota conissans TaxID=109636 RepID=A0A9P6D493_9AGAR|nr:hypothetical protein BDN70DRAFT_990451 [Pholiota conissans]
MVATLFRLPTELLEEAFSYLSRQELQSLIFVCKRCADVGRPLLYQYISLESGQENVQHTLNLLYREPTIAIKISDAVLTTEPPIGDVPWILPDFFSYSVNLRSLELRGFPFSQPHDQGIFNKTLQTKCPKLVKFSYYPGAVRFPESGFELSGLRCITWQSSLATIDLKVAPMMTASVESLTHISFKGMVVHRADQPYDHFLKLRFPNLTSLELGSLIQTNTQERTNIAITEFIMDPRHGLIKHLSLGRKRSNDMFFQLRGDLLGSDSLPNLQSFEGFPENVAVMAQCQVRSLFGITSLSLYCFADANGDFNDVDQMFENIRTNASAIAAPPKLSALQSLRLELSNVHLHHRMASNVTDIRRLNRMDGFADMCPGITRWQGNLWPMYAHDFMRMFTMYEHLETISVPRLSLIYIGHDPREFFRPVVDQCRNLKRIIAQKPPYTELNHSVYSFIRDICGDLQSVTMEHTRDISMYGAF